MCCSCISRRDFLGMTSAGVAGTSLGLTTSLTAGDKAAIKWNPEKPMVCTGKTLKVQPVLAYQIYERKFQTTWREWGGIHTEQDTTKEIERMSKEVISIRKCDGAMHCV